MAQQAYSIDHRGMTPPKSCAALRKVLRGASGIRRSMVRTAESLKRTAYHESGHALVAFHTEGAHPIHKATIVPRGHALGMVQQVTSSSFSVSCFSSLQTPSCAAFS